MKRDGGQVTFEKEIILEEDLDYMQKLSNGAKLHVYYDSEEFVYEIGAFEERMPAEDDQIRLEFHLYNLQLKQISDQIAKEFPEEK